jgi:hypothetical protein
MSHRRSRLILSFSRKGKKDNVASASVLPLATASACECGHLKLRTRQGEFDWERAGVRGSDVLQICDFRY